MVFCSGFSFRDGGGFRAFFFLRVGVLRGFWEGGRGLGGRAIKFCVIVFLGSFCRNSRVRRRSRVYSILCRFLGSRSIRSRRLGCRSLGRRVGRSRRIRRSYSSSSRGTSFRSCRSRTWRSLG